MDNLAPLTREESEAIINLIVERAFLQGLIKGVTTTVAITALGFASYYATDIAFTYFTEKQRKKSLRVIK